MNDENKQQDMWADNDLGAKWTELIDLCGQATIEEDKTYAEAKKDLRGEIRSMRHKVFMLLTLITVN